MRTRSFLAALATVALALPLSLVNVVFDSPAAQAVFAEGGSGRFKGLIDWFQWGTRAGDSILAGRPVTNIREVSGMQILTTCTISNLGNYGTDRIQVKQPGSWENDGLDELYNVGGTGDRNQMLIGIANTDGGAQVQFDVACSMTVHDPSNVIADVQVPLRGLVVADAESSNKGQDEWVRARPLQEGVTWRIIDTFRVSNCSDATEAVLASDNTLTLRPTGGECPNGGPTAVAFMEDATSARVGVKGGGNSAIAIGVVSFVDWPDGPKEYGTAGVLSFPEWIGGSLRRPNAGQQATVTNVFGTAGSPFKLAELGEPALRLGDLIDGEGIQQWSANADGDDKNGTPDEDLAVPKTISAYRGGMVVMRDLVCHDANGEGGVYGWIDFNGKNGFEAAELSGPEPPAGQPFKPEPVLCLNNRFTLAWLIPADAVPQSQAIIRIGITDDQRVVAEPIGIAIHGELEDHMVGFTLDPYTISKRSTAGPSVRPGDEVTYTVEVANPLNADPSTPPETITVKDDLSGLLDGDATWVDGGTSDNADPHGEFSLDDSSKELTWTGPPPAKGQSVILQYKVKYQDAGGGTLDNVAWVDNPGITDTPECDVDQASGRDPVTDEPCAVNDVNTPHLRIQKTSTHKPSDRSNSEVAYTITATNEGPGAYTADNPAVVLDDLTDVLDDATYQDNLNYSLSGTPDQTLPVIGWTGALAVGQTVTLTYSVLLNPGIRANSTVRNVAWSPLDPDNPVTPTCTSSPDPDTGAVCAVESFDRPNVAITKVMEDPPADPVPGAVLKFKVTVTQTGKADFEPARPLVIADDLSDVWDGTAYQADAAAKVDGQPVGTVTMDQNAARLYWTGPLAVGRVLEITYSFVLTGHGNGIISNTAWAPRGQTAPGTGVAARVPEDCQVDASHPEAGGVDGYTGEPCAQVRESRPLLRLSKTHQTDALNGPLPGTRVRYTITGVNVGAAGYTTVPIWDDITDTLIDADLDLGSLAASVGSVPTVETDGGRTIIKWAGALGTEPANNTVTITYSAVLKATGDGRLRNVAWVPRVDPPSTPNCDRGPSFPDDDDTREVCAADELNRPLLELGKASTGDDVRPGDTVHYTVTAKNVGQAAFVPGMPALVLDNLTGALDDSSRPTAVTASLSPSSGTPADPVFVEATRNLRWSGNLAVDQTLTIGYDMLVNGQGDLNIKDIAWAPTDRTVLVPPACEDAGGDLIQAGVDAATGQPCGAISHLLPRAKITKTANPGTGTAKVGDLVTFTIAIENTGRADFTTEHPLVVMDSLVQTLADSTLVSQPALDYPAKGSLSWVSAPLPVLKYSGALAKGDTVSITYQVELNAQDDGHIVNLAWAPTVADSPAPPTCTAVDSEGRDQTTGEACSLVQVDFPVLRVSKSYDVTRDQNDPDELHYTVRVTNISRVPFTDATILDDLSDVAANTDWVEGSLEVNPNVGTAVHQGDPQNTISWTGPLAAAGQPGATVIINYQVTVNGGSSSAMRNVAWQPASPGGSPTPPDCDPAPGGADQTTGEPCALSEAPLPAVQLSKTHRFVDSGGTALSPQEPVPGAQVEYTITAENISEVDYTLTSPLVLQDDLSDILAGAQMVPDSWSWEFANPTGNQGSVRYAGERLTWTGPLRQGQVLTLKFRVTLSSGGVGTLRNVVWEPHDPYDPAPEGPSCEGTVVRDSETDEACAANEFARPALALTKIATPSPGAGRLQAGDTVTYRITATNTGQAAFTATNPARVFDSLKQMLPGVTYQDDAAASDNGQVVYEADTLKWSGALEPEASVVITYSVVLKAVGPSTLVNTAWFPTDPGDPAVPTCTGSGTVRGSLAPCATVSSPRVLVHLEKTALAPDVPRPGGEVTYVLRLTNIGDGDFTASQPVYLLDDLTDLLANAEWKTQPYVSESPSTGPGTLAYSPETKRLSWTGALPHGETVAIVYSITLTAGGDAKVDNIAWAPVAPDAPVPQPEDCPVTPDDPDPNSAGRCAAAEVPRASLVVTKRPVGVPEVPHTGDILTYEISARNTGAAAFTTASPAVVYDDLSGVLGGASYRHDAKAEFATGPGTPAQPSYVQPLLSWSGPLAAGQEVVITYTVRLTGSTQAVLTNTAWEPNNPLGPGAKPAPACEDSEGDSLNGSVDPVTGEMCANLRQDRGLLSITKSVDDQTPVPGNTLTYTITVTNVSGVDFTDGHPATVWDDLAPLAQEADYVVGSETATLGQAEYHSDIRALRWQGPVPSGGQVKITYQIKVTAEGDGLYRNVVWVPFDPTDSAPEAPQCEGSADGQPVISVATGQICAGLSLRGPLVALTKSSYPTGTVAPGETISYTIRASNAGLADFSAAEPMVIEDDLTNVLDDAALVPGSLTAILNGVSVPAPELVEGTNRLHWSGPVPQGGNLVINYVVKVHGGGDGYATNVAWEPLDPANPVTPSCALPVRADTVSGEVCDAETRPLPKLSVTKELVSQPPYDPGSKLRYEITISNIGPADFTVGHPAVVIDDFSDLLDGATFDGDQAVDPAIGTLVYRAPNLIWSGRLDRSGGTTSSVKLTYSFTKAVAGDGLIRNVAWQPDTPGVPANPGPVPDCDQPSGPVDPTTNSPCGVVEEHYPTLTIVKESDGHNRVLTAGDTVTYTIRGTNTGREDFTAEDPARLIDDLSELLDGSRFNNDQTATISGAPADSPVLSGGGRLTWTGALPVGQTVEVTFSATLTGGGNGVGRNVAWSPANSADPDPAPPACDQTTGTLDPNTSEPCAADEWVRPVLAVSKSLDTENPKPGDKVTYTIRASNSSFQDFTEEVPAVFFDDMSGLLDDASFAGLSDVELTADQPGQLTYDEPFIRWQGPLAQGEEVTLRVTVLLLDTGDGVVRNLAWRPNYPSQADPPACDQEAGSIDPSTQQPCAVDQFDKSGLKVTKVATPADPMPGEEVTYEVTLENTGAYDYTNSDPAWVFDDLSDLLSLAELTTPPTANPAIGEVYTGRLGFDGKFSWNGPLGRDESVTLTYKVTLEDTMSAAWAVNTAWTPRRPATPVTPACDSTADGAVEGVDVVTGEACARVALTPPVLDFTKSSVISRPGETQAPPYARPGDQAEYTLTIRNQGTGSYTGAHPAVVIDTLADVLDDATWDGTAQIVSGGGALEWNGTDSRLSWTGQIAPNGVVVITYSVTLKAGGDGRLSNLVWVPVDPDDPGDPPSCDQVTGAWCATDELPMPELSIVKSTKQIPAGGDLQSGVKLEYTLDLTNTGQGDFTEAVPAVAWDDLTGILDDSVWSGLVSKPADGAVTWASPVLSWIGPLAAGDSVKLVYAVTLTSGGDGDLRNVAWFPADPDHTSPPQPACQVVVDGIDSATGEPCDRADLERPILEIVSKSVDGGNYARAGDWLDYEVVAVNRGPIAFTEQRPAVIADSLEGVLDDSEPFDVATASDGGAGGTISYAEPVLMWRGPLAPDERVVLTYRIQLASGGDTLIENVTWGPSDPKTAAPPAPECDDPDAVRSGGGLQRFSGRGTDPVTGETCACVELSPPVLEVTKTSVLERPGQSVAPPYARPGDEVVYTYRVRNTSLGAFTSAHPAVVLDSLEDVLDDAAPFDIASASDNGAGGTLSYTEPLLSWSGALAAGQEIVVTYRVRLTDAGNGSVRNVVWAPSDPASPGATPTCDEPVGEWCAGDTVPMPELSVSKSVSQSPANGNWQAGVRLVYTLSFKNTGKGDFIDAVPAVVRDDLTGILDDSVWEGITSKPSAGKAVWSSPTLVWTGPLGSGQTAKLSYAVVLTAQGDGHLPNLVWYPNQPGLSSPPPPGCQAPVGGLDPVTGEPCAVIENDRPILEIVSKSLDGAEGSLSQARPGDSVTYRIVAANRGPAAFGGANPAVVADSLAAVLDDALPFDLSTASDGGGGGEFSYDRPVLSWAGPLAPGAEVVLTYRITLTGGGDGVLNNLAWVPPDPDAIISPPTPTCPMVTGGLGLKYPGSGPECGSVVTYFARARVAKSVAAPNPVGTGSVLNYSIRVTNVGRVPFTADLPAQVIDDMSGLAKNASYLDNARASSGTLSYSEGRLVWTGPLAVGASAAITYSARVTGSGQLRNTAWTAGSSVDVWVDSPPAECRFSCSTLVVRQGGKLPFTGAGGLSWLVLLAFAATGGGILLLGWRRRRYQ
jgi:uncharacterized repeat protein (TIGR01451 family)/fimbrial isopeptide formation D2 family protein